jgi:hypothetical protein
MSGGAVDNAGEEPKGNTKRETTRHHKIPIVSSRLIFLHLNANRPQTTTGYPQCLSILPLCAVWRGLHV